MFVMIVMIVMIETFELDCIFCWCPSLPPLDNETADKRNIIQLQTQLLALHALYDTAIALVALQIKGCIQQIT